jgi:Domain of unknown function (DUF4105)
MPRRHRRRATRERPPGANCKLAMIWLVTVIMCPLAIWGCCALWYRAPGTKAVRILTAALWAAFSLVLLLTLVLLPSRMPLALAVFAAGFGGLLLWWRQLLPSNDRVWADDVAKMTSGSVDGHHVVLHNVRNFDWRSVADYTQRWETRSYNLDRLVSVDLVVSYWTIRAIAHVLISFGFNDGDQVVFSVEIRREKDEEFSAIGGFFKEFELSVLAADERDVIRLRTNVRGEDDYLYRLRLPPAAMRSLFLAYVEQANRLVRAPRFYSTITVNCTTLVHQMMNHIVGNLPVDYRLVFSGYLPGYVHQVGGLDPRYTLEELRALGRITERARMSDRSSSFSADIRRGVPALP